jgi:hypothetical protein
LRDLALRASLSHDGPDEDEEQNRNRRGQPHDEERQPNQQECEEEPQKQNIAAPANLAAALTRAIIGSYD